MKSNKRFLSLLTCLLLSGTLTCYSKVFAASENTIIQNTQPNIVINNSGEYIPNEVIQDIIRDNPGAQNIIIYQYYETEKNALSSFSINALPKVRNVVKTTTTHDAVAADLFVTSVAKGQSTTLSSKWTGSLEFSITGECKGTEIGLKKSVTKEYSTSFVFNGPPEGSSYNSREYRVKFYEDRGTYTAERSNGAPGGGGAWRTVSGSWTEPTSYAAYSVDKKIR